MGARCEIAPTSCPECGEEKRWHPISDPDAARSRGAARASVFARIASCLGPVGVALGLTGHALSASARREVMWHCDKCHCTKTYLED